MRGAFISERSHKASNLTLGVLGTIVQASEVTSQDLSAAGPSRKSSAKRGGKTRTRAAVDVDGADPASSAGAQGTDEGGRARTRRRARKQVQETNVGERPGAPGSAIVVLDDGSDSDYEALGSQKASKAAKPKTKEKAPLPTLTLDVRGTMKASETAKAHPFFAKKPPAAKAPEGAPAGSGANGGVTPGDAGTSGAGPAAETSSGPSRKPADTFFGKAKRRPQLEPLWPSLESIHVRPEGRLHLQLHEREARLAAIQQGFNGGQEDGSIFSTINKGKGKQRESPTGTANQVDPTLAYFAGRAELAKRSAGAADSAGSSSLHPSSIRARHEDFVSSFIASNIDFSKCSMGDVLPPAIQRARSIATSRQAAPDRPLNRSVTKLVESWADRWHPLCAAECLGNEPRAIYLREWMRELQITRVAPVRSADGVTQGTGAEGMTARLQEGGANTSASALLPSQKKRPVQKKVEKKAVQRAKRRKKNRDGYGPEDDNGDMADFIVDDEDDSWLDAYPSSMKDSCDEELAAHTHRTQPDPSAVNDMLRRAIDGATGPNRMQIDPQLSASPSPATVTTPLPGTSASALPHVGLENSGSEDFARADKLTNCILLCGPTGAGKTASVYACAAELGYEVFELWPGMGKRGGKDLSSAVGALGRNHMVSSGGTGGGAMWRGNAAMRTKPSATESGADVYSKLLAAANGQNGADEHCGDADGIATPTAELHSAVEAGSTSGVISAQSPDNPNNTLPNSNALGDTPSLKEKDLSVRQSLILIEEVDIVYEEDKSFWAGIVALTAESRRPVVLTCNGECTLCLYP